MMKLMDDVLKAWNFNWWNIWSWLKRWAFYGHSVFWILMEGTWDLI